MATGVEVAAAVLLLSGALLCVTGGLGLLRLPDFYTRTHAGGLTDTLGATLIVLGLMLYAGFSMVSVKLALIAVILHVTSPTGTHALVKAAYSKGLRCEADGAPTDAAGS